MAKEPWEISSSLLKNSVFARQGPLKIRRLILPAGCSKGLSSKVAASEEARRYVPHFVGPFALTMDLGERKSPSSASGLRNTLFNVEPLSEARTKLVDFFSRLPGLTCTLPNEQRIEVPESVVLWSQGQEGAREHLAIKPHTRGGFSMTPND